MKGGRRRAARRATGLRLWIGRDWEMNYPWRSQRTRLRLDLVVAVFGGRTTGEVLLLENETTDWSQPRFTPRVLDERHGSIHDLRAGRRDGGRPDGPHHGQFRHAQRARPSARAHHLGAWREAAREPLRTGQHRMKSEFFRCDHRSGGLS
jgi:hypothetical protein